MSTEKLKIFKLMTAGWAYVWASVCS